VERAGVQRWLSATGRGAGLKEFLDLQERRAKFLVLLEQTRTRLKALYGLPLAPEAMRERKRAEFAPLKAVLESFPRLKDMEPNNALLASFASYTQLVPAFERLLQEEGGDLEKSIPG